jgi:hypothetical protein
VDYRYIEATNASQRRNIAAKIYADIRNEQTDINNLTDEQLDELTKPTKDGE